MLQINDFVIDKPEEELFAYHRSTMTSPEILSGRLRAQGHCRSPHLFRAQQANRPNQCLL